MSNPKPKRRWFTYYLLPIGIAVFVVSVTLNLRAARSATNTNTTSSVAKAVYQGVSIDVPGHTRKLCLHMSDRQGLASRLSWQLRRELEATGRFDVYLINNEPRPEDYPLLVAEIAEPRVFWTPFYASADVDIYYGYASYTTDIATTPEETTTLDAGSVPEKFQLRVHGSISVEDSTVGLVTLPAYRQHLTDEPAKRIVETLTAALDKVVADAEPPAP